MKALRIILYTSLFILLILAFYFRTNADKIYAGIGDFYTKNSNFEKAQNFYEKSLNLGNKDLKFREKYVNSLINAPLTLEIQTKLVKIAEGERVDSAQASAEYFLYNLRREIHDKYPENYIGQAPYNNKIMHWGALPITYTFKHTGGVPDEIIDAINSAFDEWERASSCRIKFERVKTSQANIIVDFIAGYKESPKEGEKYIVAYTTPFISQNQLKNMVIKFNILDAEKKHFSPNQMYNTALHEIFHALGYMGHSYTAGNIMYMSKDKDSVINDTKRTLTEADKTTLELLYKIRPDITNANNLKYDYISYLVLGDNDDINYSKTREAKNYIKKAPNLPNGYIDYAEILASEKKYPEAIRNLEKAERLSRSNDSLSTVYYNLAVCYFYIANYGMAEDYVKRAIEIKDSEDLHEIGAEIYLKQEKFELAEKEYKYLISLSSDNSEYVRSLANLYIKRHEYLKARKILKDFLKKNPKEKQNPAFSQYGILLF